MEKVRIKSYDLFRGILLVAMVIFHIIVNLTSLQFDQRLFYFVPAGFVLFLGVILARFLKGRTRKKLWLAAKLFLLFLIFNIPNLVNKEFGIVDFIGGNQQIFSFEILFPMTVVILLTIFFDRFFGKLKNGQQIWLGFLLSFGLALAALNYLQIYYYNLSFTIYGIIGYFATYTFDLDDFLQKTKDLRKCINLVYFALFLIVVIGPLILIYLGYFYELVIVIQIFALYYLCGILLGNNAVLVFLGKHSLFLYVSHIVIIKLLLVI